MRRPHPSLGVRRLRHAGLHHRGRREWVTDSRTVFTPGEVARVFGVGPKTMIRWCVQGHLAAFRTPGGHRRIRLAAVLDLLREIGFDDHEVADAVRRLS